MKKLFTLVAFALSCVVANAQDVYEAIVNGSLAPEFAAVVGDGGVATNNVDGKSIITMTAGKATVTAVGGSTPADEQDNASDKTATHVAIDAEGNVSKWNDIKWEKKSQGDIDFNYITGTGTPYVDITAEPVMTDGAQATYTDDNGQTMGKYRPAYTYYAPDGSLGLPITGLYYKFTASAKGAFKVKVWANKGNRFTFVVNEATKKAERLFASGYINSVNDANGQKRFLSVEQVDSVHMDFLASQVTNILKNGSALDSLGVIDSLQTKANYQYIIGRGNQAFYGWLTFDVEPGETYWVFQHSSQIGFGGFEFYEGQTADELIKGIEPPFAYTTNFSTYVDEETGEVKAWKGEKIVGSGEFVQEPDDAENIIFSTYFQNKKGDAPRQNYLLLPEDVLAHSANTEALTMGVWVNAEAAGESADYMYAPLFTAYGAQNNPNSWPMMVCQYRGLLQVNNAGWCDYTDAQNVAGANKVYNDKADWLKDKKWHYYTVVFEGNNAKVYFDGKIANEWALSGDGDGNVQKGLFSNGADLKYVCLGGNQAWDWADLDSGFKFAKLMIANSAKSIEEISMQMDADFPGGLTAFEEYIGSVDNAIQTVKVSEMEQATYNLAGQRVANGTKGMLIKNGKKFIVK